MSEKNMGVAAEAAPIDPVQAWPLDHAYFRDAAARIAAASESAVGKTAGSTEDRRYTAECFTYGAGLARHYLALVAEVERLTNDLRSVKPAMQAEQRRHAKARQDMHTALREVERLREALDSVAFALRRTAGDILVVSKARAAPQKEPSSLQPSKEGPT